MGRQELGIVSRSQDDGQGSQDVGLGGLLRGVAVAEAVLEGQVVTVALHKAVGHAIVLAVLLVGGIAPVRALSPGQCKSNITFFIL